MFDLIIIGSGPAGLTASIYASRYKLANLIVGKSMGGTITYASEVENYPGINSITGVELGKKMINHAKSLGAEIISDNVDKIETIKENQGFRIFGESKKIWEGKALILATGTERRKLNVPGEQKYLGKGISYCPTCDAPFFKGKTVVLVGGSDAACSGAVHLAEYVNKVYLIYRGEALRAEPSWLEDVKTHPKIEIIYHTNVAEVLGDETMVTGVKLDRLFKNQNIIPVAGVFVEIGGTPGNFLAELLGAQLDDNGYVIVNEDMSTNISGFFAAGDLTNKSKILVQVITACAQGAIAAASVYKYIKGQKPAQIQGI
ncbi:MAG: FAD-dependent oxidoreductase [Candidatus Gottesmanbacteria bacterium]